MKSWNGERTKYAQYKYDGIYCQINKFKTGDFFFASRNGIELDVAFCPDMQPVYGRLPREALVCGELYYPGKPASYVKTAIKEKDKNLRFISFAAYHLDHKLRLETLRDWCMRMGFEFAPFTSFKEEGEFDSFVETMEENLPEGIEGYVFKNGNMQDWYKWKPVKTIDLIVYNCMRGKGKYYKTLGSLICKTAEGHEVASVSGMTDEERDEFWNNKPFGKVIEVAYQYVGSKGRLRHPRFIRVREDKSAEECTIHQDLDLEKFYASS